VLSSSKPEQSVCTLGGCAKPFVTDAAAVSTRPDPLALYYTQRCTIIRVTLSCLTILS
jgi:hypothetical protein